MPDRKSLSLTWSRMPSHRVLFALFFGFCIYAAKDFQSPNVVSRLALSHAIVTRGELTIDEVERQTVDKAFHEGHYYCDKAPGISLMCVPAVLASNFVADRLGWSRELFKRRPSSRFGPTPRYVLMNYACLMSSAALMGALLLVSFWRTLQALRVGQLPSMVVALIFGFGTPVLLWSTVVFGHVAAAAFLFLAFAQGLLETAEPRGDSLRSRWAGFFLGMAVLTEFTAAPPAILVALFFLFARVDRGLRKTLRRGGWLILGALLPLALLLTYNQAAFGSMFKLGYGAVQGFAGMKTGFFGISTPSRKAAFGILFSGYRGILWLSPILALAFFAGLDLLRRPGRERSVGLLVLGITAYYLLLNSGYYYWDGGSSTGPRHITPIAPFLMFALGLAYARPRSLGFKAATIALGGISVFIVSTCALVRVTALGDHKPMLSAHVFPELFGGKVKLLPSLIGVRFMPAYFFALGAVAVVGYLLLKRSMKGRSIRAVLGAETQSAAGFRLPNQAETIRKELILAEGCSHPCRPEAPAVSAGFCVSPGP